MSGGCLGILQSVEQPLKITAFHKTTTFLSKHVIRMSAQSHGGNGTVLGVDGIRQDKNPPACPFV